MRQITMGLIAVSLLLSTAVDAGKLEQRSAAQVLEHHVTAFRNGDMAQLAADYSDQSVVVTPAGLTAPGTSPGVYVGAQSIQKLFELFAQPENAARNKAIETTVTVISSDVLSQHWTMSRGTPQEASGTDTFIIRGGKIVFQDIQPQPAKS